MHRWQRMRVSLLAKLDGLLGDMENHDAVAEATLDALASHLAEGRVAVRQLEQTAKRSRSRRDDATARADTWRRRARESRETDPNRALAALRRAKATEAEANAANETLVEQEAAIERLSARVQALGDKVEAARQTRHQLQARQALVAGAQALSESPLGASDALFDRWECALLRDEALSAGSLPSEADPFEVSFEEEENTRALRDELEAL